MDKNGEVLVDFVEVSHLPECAPQHLDDVLL